MVRSASPLPVAVVCDDTVVADWARRLGALVVWEPGRGLNGAVEAGVRHLAAMGVEYVTVAHGDLPHAAGLGELAPFDGVTLVPDRSDDGTNVIRVPPAATSASPTGPAPSPATVPSARASGCRSGSCGTRPWPSTSTGRPTCSGHDASWGPHGPHTHCS